MGFAAKMLVGALRFALGAALFSFADTAAWRLARGQSALRGRSRCPACGAELDARDLIPAVSWVLLRGRCRRCGAAIGVRGWLAELLGGALALGCGLRFGAARALTDGLFGPTWAALWALAVCALLYAVAAVDAETQTIPNRFPLALAVCGALGSLPVPGTLLSRVAGAACLAVPMLLLCLPVPDAFGGGDIKLAAAAGLCLGLHAAVVAGFLALLGGGAWGAFLLLTHRAARRDRIAFGPFLCAGTALALFFGDALWAWYTGFM